MAFRPSVLALLASTAAAQVHWQQQIFVTGIPPRPSCGIVYDEARAVTVVFGGYGGSTGASSYATLADTWAWDGAVWTERHPAFSPPPMFTPLMIYDAARSAVVCMTGNAPMQVYEYDGASWSAPGSPTVPTPRHSYSLAYDRVHARTLLFGGEPTWFQQANDTWLWDGTNWSATAPVTLPPPRTSPTMVFDPARQSVLMMNGYWSTGPYTGGSHNDAWEWNGTDWSQVQPQGTPPQGFGHAFADLGGNRVLFFPPSGSRYFAWNGTAWTSVPYSGPGPTTTGRFALDLARNRAVRFGIETWEVDLATSGFVQRTAQPVLPRSRFGHGLAWHDASQRLVMWGGADAGLYTDMWAWDGATWSPLAPSQTPPGRFNTPMVGDRARGEIVLFGGQGNTGGGLGDTWTFDGATWTQRAPPTSPSPRYGHGIAYDSARARVVIFGGQGGGNQTWEWDGNTWSQVNAPVRPSPRYLVAMTYDPVRRHTVLFGGFSTLTDTWTFDGAAWQQRSPSSTPPPFNNMMTWDTARGRGVLFGYNTTSAWEWDGANWTARATAAVAPPRGEGGLAYDEARRQVVLFSGINTGTKDDTWVYAPTVPATWTDFGTGCPGTLGTPSLAAAPGSLPWLGDSFALQVGLVPAGQAALFALGTKNQWGGVALPLALGAYGMPGCTLLAGGFVLLTVPGNGGIATVTIAIPNQPALLGGTIDGQALVVDPGANAANAVLSAGGTLTVGGR